VVLGWDEDHLVPTADASFWEQYLMKHTEAKEFRKKLLSHYKQLHDIFSGASVATGRYALQSRHCGQGTVKWKHHLSTSIFVCRSFKARGKNLFFLKRNTEGEATSNTKISLTGR
jgi:hypothetical protein